MADKVKQVALDEAERVKAQTIQAARSAAYLYPLRVSLPAVCPSISATFKPTIVWLTASIIGYILLYLTP